MPPEPVDVVPLLSAAKVTVVAGKGGVGKTTVTALLARAAADAGGRVIVVELDGKSTLAELVGDVPLLALSAPLALEEYLREHGFGRVAKRLAASGVIDVVSTAAPGIDDLVVLGKIKQLERSGDWDTIVVDGPAAGHAVTMLTSPAGLRDAVTSGPVRAQADDVLAMLGDAAAVPGRPRHPRRDDAGQRDDRDRVHDRGSRRGQAGAGVRQRCRRRRLASGHLASNHRRIASTRRSPSSTSMPTLPRRSATRRCSAANGGACSRRRSTSSCGSLPLDQLHVPFVAGRLDGAAVARLARDVRRGRIVAGTGPASRPMTTTSSRGGDVAVGARRRVRRRLLRFRRGRQDDRGGGVRRRGGATRPAGRRPDDRPGEASRRCPRRRRARPRAAPDRARRRRRRR